MKKRSKAKQFRWIQLVAFTHRIHHIHYSYGYKLPLLPIGYFDDYGFKKIQKQHYHNCTLTGVY